MGVELKPDSFNLEIDPDRSNIKHGFHIIFNGLQCSRSARRSKAECHFNFQTKEGLSVG